MKTVNIQAAKTHLSRLVEEVASGNGEVILAKAGKPLVRMVPYAAPRKARLEGILAGQGWEAPDCWSAADDPLGTAAEAPLFHGAVEEAPDKD